MADQPRIKPVRTEQVFVRITAGQRAALVELGEDLCRESPAESYRWRGPDGEINISAVVRAAISARIPGWQQR